MTNIDRSERLENLARRMRRFASDGRLLVLVLDDMLDFMRELVRAVDFLEERVTGDDPDEGDEEAIAEATK